jgi:hypothetical protein
MKLARGSLSAPLLAIALTVAFVAPAFAFTYTYPLSSSDIREAYFIGHRNDEITSNFLATYTRHLDKPSSGPYISDVAIVTPFTQIVTYVAKQFNYDAPTAVQDFQDKPMKFYAHITIYVANDFKIEQTNPTNSVYPSFRAFWEDYKYKLTQDKTIRPLAVTGGFLYAGDIGSAPGDGTNGYIPIGATVDLAYAADAIQAAPATFTIDTPDGEHVEATFDLASLR